jgi:carbon monoxide dehydrogenase subunit G
MATAAEVNNACDVSVRVQELTESGAVTAGVQSVELNHDTTAIEATIADASNHQGLFVVKATAEPAADNDHTLTLTAGTFNGTNDVATFADINDALIVYFDSDGNGTVIENVGTVALSSSS